MVADAKVKRPYQPPRLRVYGPMTDLTGYVGFGTIFDVSGKTAKKQKSV
jgi:hypothetical protein